MTSTAKVSPLTASIFGSTPEEDAKLAQLREAQERLQSALMDRKPMFDPMLLAMAQGFLAPNPSGNFFNALGNVAGKVGQAQEVEEKRQLERMQLQNELLKSQYDQMVQAREAQEVREIFGGLGQRSGLQSFAAANQGNPPLSSSNTDGSAPRSAMGDSLVTESPEFLGAEGRPLVAEPPVVAEPLAATKNASARPTQDRYIGDLSEQQVLRLASLKNPIAQQLLKAYFDIKAGRRENIKILPNGTLVDLSDPKQVDAYQRSQETQALAQARLINPDGTINQDALRVFGAGAADPFKVFTDANAASVAIRRLFGPNVKDEVTPFDAIISLSGSLGTQGSTIKSHAERLAERYRQGLIPEDRANTLAQQMIDGATRYMDAAERRRVEDQYREDRLAILNQSVQNTQAHREAMATLQRELAEGRRQDEAARLAQRKTEEERRAQDARDRAEDRRRSDAISQGIQQQRVDLERERLERVRKENEGKLTDEQKMVFRANVLPIINEGTKAQTAITQLGALEDKINKAPSGVFAGTMARSVGALFGTDANTALRELESLSKGLIPTIPRLPGAASNLDSQNLEASLGKLYDPTLTNEQRRELVKTIRQTYQKLYDRALRVEDTWNSSKTFNMQSLNATPPQSSTPDQRYRVIR